MESTAVSGEEVAHDVLEAKTWCNVQKNAAEARQRAATDLQLHLAQCINKPDCSGDVVFNCKNGQRVYASKLLCMGRSEMLTALFNNGMSETSSSTVTLPEIHSGALLSILEYLYTGDICNHRPTDWITGLEVIATARYFMLSSCVEHIVEELLLEHVNDAGKDLRQAAIMLSLAVEQKASYLESVGGLIHFLRRAWMHGDCVSFLSEEAFDLVLRRTKNTEVMDGNHNPSLYDFFRFRGILMWALCHSNLITVDDAQSLFDRIIPCAKGKLYRLQGTETSEMEVEWLPGYEVDSASNEILDKLQAHRVCKEAAVRLLANVNWAQIPPQLFTRIVEPLKLVSDLQLMHLFRCYYINRPSNVHLSWIHGSQLLKSRQGFCIKEHECLKYLRGTAVCELSISPDERLHVWTFKVERLVSNLYLGFVFWQDRAEVQSWNFETSFLSAGMQSKYQNSARALEVVNDREGWSGHIRPLYAISNPNGGWNPLNCKAQSPTVEFRYDRDARECSVKVGSLDLGPVFKDLPCQSFFPALSMESMASVTIAVHSGFDIVRN